MRATGLGVLISAWMALVVCLSTLAAQPVLYSHGEPTPFEQYMLELVNAARADPGAEAARLGIDLNQGLAPGTIENTPKPPLAFHPLLIAAARRHSDWMLSTGTFSHTGAGNSSPTDRALNEGYTFPVAENIGYRSTSGAPDYLGMTRLIHESLVISPGHRVNLMDATYSVVGLGLRPGSFGGQNAFMAAQNFSSGGANVDSGPFILGVCYDDANGNRVYDPGEGVPSVRVDISPGSHYVITSASGGYALPVVPDSTNTETVNLPFAVQGTPWSAVIPHDASFRASRIAASSLTNVQVIWSGGPLTVPFTNTAATLRPVRVNYRLLGTDGWFYDRTMVTALSVKADLELGSAPTPAATPTPTPNPTPTPASETVWSYSVNPTTSEATITRYTGAGGAVIIPSSIDGNRVTSIALNAFSGSTSLTSVIIPDSVTTIEGGAFSGCTSLAGVTIPDSVTTIEGMAFLGCTSLTSVTIPDSVTSIGPNAFRFCSNLNSVIIPDSVTSVGLDAFSGCTSLTSVIIPDSVTGIGAWAFSDCTKLTNVTIGNGVTNIGSYAFSGCTSLTSVSVDTTNPKYSDLAGVLFDKLRSTLLYYPPNKSDASYAIPNGVTGIAESALSDCTKLTSITIPDSVTSIGSYAFSECTSLASVNIPDSVTSIGSSAFSGCTKLSNVTIGNGVTSIGLGAFSGCTSLTSVTMGDGVARILDGAFSGCTSLASVNIPDSVTTIGSYAFSGCTSLTNVIVPGSETIIGSRAFSGCTKLTSVTVGDGVTAIGIYAFSGCTSLASVMMGNGVTDIGNYAFSGCTSLAGVTVPDSVTSIRNGAFSGCTSLANVKIGNSVTSIGRWAFSRCTSLTSVTIPNSVTKIGERAFLGCTKLTNVTVGNSVTAIGNNTFYGCSSLTSALFLGNAPEDDGSVIDVFEDATPVGTVYYIAGSLGWLATYSGWPTQMLPRPTPTPAGTKEQRVTFKLPPKIVYGGEYILRAKFSAKGPVTYSVDDTTVAEIDGGNRLRILKAGSAFKVTARHPGDATWKAAEIEVEGTAAKRPQKIAFTTKGVRKVEETFPLSVTVNSELDVTVTSSNPEIVRINENGTATALKPGKVELTATQGGDGNYSAAKSVKKKITVK